LVADPGGSASVGAPLAPSVPDAVLVVAARDGDLRAWERLVRRHQEGAFQVAYLITRQTALAEAATAAAFVRAYRALPTLRDGIEFRPWLLGVVTGEARRRGREATRIRNTSREEVLVQHPRLTAQPLAAAAQVAALSPKQREDAVSAFERLSDDDRLVIAARYHLGMSAADAATVSGIPEGTAGMRLGQAIRRLRARLVEA
jgi:RNA polymerase sigma-70 factor (ECF subfamily)